MNIKNVVTGNGVREAKETGPMGKELCKNNIPIIDLSSFNSYGEDCYYRQISTAREVFDAAINTGFFYVSNHGVNSDLISNVFNVSKYFFNLRSDYKLKLNEDLREHRRGYNPPSKNTNNVGNKESLESFYAGSEPPHHLSDYHQEYCLNIWPSDNPFFVSYVSSYFTAMSIFARTMFQVFALALNLPADFFKAYTDHPGSMLRMLHYRPQTIREYESEMLGARAHSDHNWFTILAQDCIGGLQVLGNDGYWIAATPIAGTFVINIGDQLSRFTNNTFKSTVHRVVNVNNGDRYSVAFFNGIDHEKYITPMDNNNPLTTEESIRSGDYLLKRRNETYAS